MFHSRLLAAGLLIMAAVSILTSCSEPRVEEPTRAIATPTAASAAIAAGIVTATVPSTATSTDTRLSSPQPATPSDLATLSPSNGAVVTAVARTLQPTPLITPLANEAGIIPGQTEAEVLAILGQPRSKERYRDMDVWVYRSPKDLTLPEVTFDSGRASEIALLTPSLTAQMVVAQYGPPEVVVFYPQVQHPTPAPPAAPPSGKLVYPSKGLLFEFFCAPTRKPPCTGVPRDVGIAVKFYFLPTTIGEWAGHQVLPPGLAELRPWTGFTD